MYILPYIISVNAFTNSHRTFFVRCGFQISTCRSNCMRKGMVLNDECTLLSFLRSLNVCRPLQLLDTRHFIYLLFLSLFVINLLYLSIYLVICLFIYLVIQAISI